MSQRLRIINKFFKLFSWPFLLLLVLSRPAYAQDIKTQAAQKILQIAGNDSGLLVLPSDVSVRRDKIYVVDGGHHRIAVFDRQGQFLFEFGAKGSEDGYLNYPLGIHVATDNRVYIADSGNHRIQIYTDKGDFLSGFEVKSGNKSIRPIDVIRHSRTGNIVVSGNTNHRIMVFSPQGKLLYEWGGNGMNQGEFRYPATISELKDGRIAVVDVLNTRVQVFHPDGKASIEVGNWGVLQGQLVRPKGVAIDNKGNFYISDSYMNLVQSFSESGEFIAVLGVEGQPYQMNTPVGMTVDDDNRLYVVEMRANRVSVYQLSD